MMKSLEFLKIRKINKKILIFRRRQSSQNTSTATETKNPEALLAKADKCLAALRTFCGDSADFGGQLKLKNFDSAGIFIFSFQNLSFIFYFFNFQTKVSVAF